MSYLTNERLDAIVGALKVLQADAGDELAPIHDTTGLPTVNESLTIACELQRKRRGA